MARGCAVPGSRGVEVVFETRKCPDREELKRRALNALQEPQELTRNDCNAG